MHLRNLWLPLLAAWRGAELDRHLAAGVSPQTSTLHMLRARKLTSDRTRKRVADCLERAYRRASKATPGFTAAVRPNVDELLAAQAVLAAIDLDLRSTAPVEAQGVAMLQVLLTDGDSPLYQAGEPGALGSRLRGAAAALECALRPHPRALANSYSIARPSARA